jgi:hypothetical protein
MRYLDDRTYSRANELATALEERFLHESHPDLVGDRPLSADNWASQSRWTAVLLDVLAWAVAPTTDHQPDPRVLDQLPSGLISDLRRRERSGERIAGRLRRASRDLSSERGRWDSQDTELICDIARRAEDEASDALRSMTEF